MARKQTPKFIACTEKYLPVGKVVEAAQKAVNIFPANAPAKIAELDSPLKIAVQTSKFWGDRIRDMTVGFMERPSAAMIDKVLAFANSWGEFSKAKFRYTENLSNAIIRISFGRGGYWSYLGTDCLSIPRNRQTMNLEGFTVNTSLSEWNRVLKHEFGHAQGCPHEHQRQDIIDLLDVQKVIALFRRTQGWTEQEIRQQILTPLEERSLMGGSIADVMSIMAYQFPGSVTKSGQPIPGGMDFSPIDKAYFGKIYPKDEAPPPPPPPPPPPGDKQRITIEVDGGPVTGARVLSVT